MVIFEIIGPDTYMHYSETKCQVQQEVPYCQVQTQLLNLTLQLNQSSQKKIIQSFKRKLFLLLTPVLWR